MSYREFRKAVAGITEVLGRTPRRDRRHEDAAAKQRAYRERKKSGERITLLYDLAYAAMGLGGKTAAIFLSCRGEDPTELLIETFERSARARGMSDEAFARLQALLRERRAMRKASGQSD